MALYSGDIKDELLPPNLQHGDSEVVWVTHDESIFYANDDDDKGWYEKAHPDLFKKGKRKVNYGVRFPLSMSCSHAIMISETIPMRLLD